MNRFVSFFSSPPDKPPPQHRIDSNSHLTNSSSSEMIAATNRLCVSRNNNNNQTRFGGSTGDRTAITPHSSRANYHPPYDSQSDASDSEQEDIQHASAPKQRRYNQRYNHYNQYEDDDIAQHSDGEESPLKKP
jgi:hypothetical protein